MRKFNYSFLKNELLPANLINRTGKTAETPKAIEQFIYAYLDVRDFRF